MTTGESIILYGLIGSALAQIYTAFKTSQKEQAAKEAEQKQTVEYRETVSRSLGTIQRSVNGALLAHQKTIWRMALRWANYTKLKEDFETAHFAELEYMNHKKQADLEKSGLGTDDI